MAMQRISAWARANLWLLALLLVVTTGFILGKDRALRDNRADHVLAGGL